uniref:Uncharacterized protein n=1 Tax=Pseudomonas fluorescens (strain SBW25) TaxID=216595 RepID=A0A0G4E507_PSEFS|nr:hypothetical protein [Pseudomonas fluorescens]CEK42259.1 hypothetical protein PQBR57_0306 [Pseudomonas fluorescens SBW25]
MKKHGSVTKFLVFMDESLSGNTPDEIDWLNFQGNQMRFDALANGDRFLTTDSLWTKLNDTSARKHSRQSRELGNEGYGHDSDQACSFDADDIVAFVRPII